MQFIRKYLSELLDSPSWTSNKMLKRNSANTGFEAIEAQGYSSGNISKRCNHVPLLCQTLGLEYYSGKAISVSVPDSGPFLFANGYIWIAVPNGLSKIDIKTATIVNTYDLGIPTIKNMHFDGTYIWAIDGVNLKKIDIVSNSVVATVNLNATAWNMPTIAFDGTNIWITNDQLNVVYKVNTTTLALTTLATFGHPGGICFDGAYIWISDWSASPNNVVYKVDTSSNAILATVSVANNYPGIMVFTGSHLIVATNTGFKKIDVSTNAVTTGAAFTDVMGMCFDGTHMWANSYSVTYLIRINVDTNVAEATFGLSNFPGQLVFDGTHVWANTDLTTNRKLWRIVAK